MFSFRLNCPVVTPLFPIVLFSSTSPTSKDQLEPVSILLYNKQNLQCKLQPVSLSVTGDCCLHFLLTLLNHLLTITLCVEVESYAPVTPFPEILCCSTSYCHIIRPIWYQISQNCKTKTKSNVFTLGTRYGQDDVREGLYFKNLAYVSASFLCHLTIVFVPPWLTFTWHVKLRLVYRCTFQLHSRVTFLAFTVEAFTPSGASMCTEMEDTG